MEDVVRYGAPFAAFLFFYALLRRRAQIEATTPGWRDPQVQRLIAAIIVVLAVAVIADGC